MRFTPGRIAASWHAASFRTRLMAPLLTLVTLLVGVLAVGSVWNFEARVEADFQHQLRFAENVSRPPLAKALWDIFDPAAHQVLEGLSNLEGFVSATVHDANGQVFAHRANEEATANVTEVITFPLIWEGSEELGTLELIVDRSGPNAAIRASRFQTAAFATVIFLALSVAILALAQTIARPLTDLSQTLPKLGQRTFEVPYQGRGDSVGELARGLAKFNAILLERDALQAKEAQAQAEAAERRTNSLEQEARLAALEADAAQVEAERQRKELSRAQSVEKERQDWADVLKTVSQRLAWALDDFAEGRLDARIQDPFPEEYEPLRIAVNKAVADLGGTVGQITRSTKELNRTSKRVRTEADALAVRAESDARMAETSASALASIAERVADTAEMTQSAEAEMASVRVALADMRDRMGESTAAMDRIGTAAAAIVKIAEVSDEVARQTNLLAINAAVEAAHAGEAGRGFAVIATEVRQLAQESAASSAEVHSLIEECQAAVRDAISAVQVADGALDGVDRRVGDVGMVVNRVEEAARLDADAAAMLQVSARDLDAAIAQNASTAVSLQSSVKDLRETVAIVGDTVGRFVLEAVDPDEITTKEGEAMPSRQQETNGAA